MDLTRSLGHAPEMSPEHAREYRSAMDMIRDGSRPQATDLLCDMAVRLPHEFDVHLALLGLRGLPSRELLETLCLCPDTAGRLRDAAGEEWNGWWEPAPHIRVPLNDHEDARGALAAYMLSDGNDGRAWRLLGSGDGICRDGHRITAGRILAARGEFEEAIAHLSPVREDRSLRPGVQLLLAYVLRSAGALMAAREYASGAGSAMSANRALKREARYLEADISREMGDSHGERLALERLYADDPDYRDVAERLFPERTEEIRWRKLRNQLGPLGE